MSAVFLSECGAAHPATQPIPIPQPTYNQPYPPDSTPCSSRCDPTPLSVPYYPGNGGTQSLIQPVNGMAGQPNLVIPPGGVPYYPFLIVPHADSMAGPINLSVAPSSDPGGCDLPQNGNCATVIFGSIVAYRVTTKNGSHTTSLFLFQMTHSLVYICFT